MQEFDIIVIGAGSGGSAVAGRLAEQGRYKICLIEAGGANTSWKIRAPGMMAFVPDAANWKFETVPQAGLNGRRGYQPRGRGLGGSSAINAMLYIRGCAWDYDQWARLGATGWRYQDVLPYFRRAEHNERGASPYHGDGGPLHVGDQRSPNPGSAAFIDAAASLQIPVNPDFNGEHFEGVGYYQVTQFQGERWSAARAYVDPQRANPQFSVRTDALVERVELEEGRARTVVLRTAQGPERIRARGAIVLAGGAFGTPQLLMLSGIGPAAHLAEQGIDVVLDRPAVGSDLQDHLDYIVNVRTPGTQPFLGRSPMGVVRGIGSIVQWMLKREGAMTSCYAETGGFVRSRPDVEVPDLQFHFLPLLIEDHGRARVPGHGFSCHVCVLRPESRGTVRLARRDAAAAPLIDPAFLADDRDLATLRAGARLARRIVQASPLAAFGGTEQNAPTDESDAALDALIRARADTIYHPVGTARMGTDAQAVCDPELRVNGVDGLYIADASVMPRLISGNTNAPTIMIGERAADFIHSHLG